MRRPSLVLVALIVGCPEPGVSPFDTANSGTASATATATATDGDATMSATSGGEAADSSGEAEADSGGGGSTGDDPSATTSGSSGELSAGSSGGTSSITDPGGTGAASTGESICPDDPTNVEGCGSCGAFCDAPWTVSWDPMDGATTYVVEYTCFLSTTEYETASTSVDLCDEVGMCDDGSCANGAGAVTVTACSATCCSNPVTVPAGETPIACGGGVCC